MSKLMQDIIVRNLTIQGAFTAAAAVTGASGAFAGTVTASTVTAGTINPTTLLSIADGALILFGSTSGSSLGFAATQKISLWGATPVVQPATTGTNTGFTTGSGTAVKDDSTFTGGVGSKAYRISDIVLALKQAGMLASS